MVIFEGKKLTHLAIVSLARALLLESKGFDGNLGLMQTQWKSYVLCMTLAFLHRLGDVGIRYKFDGGLFLRVGKRLIQTELQTEHLGFLGIVGVLLLYALMQRSSLVLCLKQR